MLYDFKNLNKRSNVIKLNIMLICMFANNKLYLIVIFFNINIKVNYRKFSGYKISTGTKNVNFRDQISYKKNLGTIGAFFDKFKDY